MVKRCAWGTCNSDDRYKEKEHMKDVIFFPIPKPKTRLEETKQWVKACGRKHFAVENVDKHSYVCSKHFVDGMPTSRFPYPVSALDVGNATAKPSRKPPTRRQLHYPVKHVQMKENNDTDPVKPVPLKDKVPPATAFVEVATQSDNVLQTKVAGVPLYPVEEDTFICTGVVSKTLEKKFHALKL